MRVDAVRADSYLVDMRVDAVRADSYLVDVRVDAVRADGGERLSDGIVPATCE